MGVKGGMKAGLEEVGGMGNCEGLRLGGEKGGGEVGEGVVVEGMGKGGGQGGFHGMDARVWG